MYTNASLQTFFAFLAVAISVYVALDAKRKEKEANIKAQEAEALRLKAEDIKLLLGEKETVGFAAVKLLKEGLPKSEADRAQVISALFNGCLFEGSDRARAILFYLIHSNRDLYSNEFESAYDRFYKVITTMNDYGFDKDALDLVKAKLRIKALRTVLDNKKRDIG